MTAATKTWSVVSKIAALATWLRFSNSIYDWSSWYRHYSDRFISRWNNPFMENKCNIQKCCNRNLERYQARSCCYIWCYCLVPKQFGTELLQLGKQVGISSKRRCHSVECHQERGITPIRTIKALAALEWALLKTASIAAWNGIRAVAGFIWNGIKNAVMVPIRAIKNLAVMQWNILKLRVLQRGTQYVTLVL